ncbi:hypothetical protein [Neoroseomonas lacus]|nr:hypothetical protein [Neoroseomonas lacus]
MTIEDIRRILREYLGQLLTADTTSRVAVEPGLPVYASWVPGMDDVATNPDDADVAEARGNLEAWKAARRSRDYASVSEEVEDLAGRYKISSEMWPTLALGIIETFIKFNEVAEHRASGEAFTVLDVAPGPVVPPALVEPTVSDTRAPSKAPLISTLVEPFFVQRESVAKATQQVMGQERGTLRRFIEAAGDRPVNEYGRGDVTAFLNTLRRLPTNYGKSPEDKKLSLADIIAQADAKGVERLSDKTVKRHLSALSQFFKFAMDLGHISNAHRTELVEDHAFKEERKARDQRDAWTSDELIKLFKSPVWTGCEPKHRATAGPEIIRDAKFWLPLLALFHGARLEEFADLRCSDVIQDENAGGLWAFDLNEEARRLKTQNAIRIVPLHPEIIRLGFLDYLTRTAPKPGDPLFPDLTPQGKDRKRGPRFTRDFRYYREAVGVYREGVGRRTVSTAL